MASKYYLVRFIDGRDGLIKDWATWDDPDNEELKGHLDFVIKAIHSHKGEIVDVSILEEE